MNFDAKGSVLNNDEFIQGGHGKTLS